MRGKKGIIVISAILCLAFLGSCSTETGSQLPELVIGYDDYRPYCYFDGDGEPAGISMELAIEACRRMGYEPVFKEIPWEEKEKYLEDGEIDCIWGCFSMNGIEDAYSWVGPYMYGRQVVAVLEDSNIYSLSDLEGKKIAVKSGTQPERIFLARTDGRIPQVKELYCLTDVDEVATALRGNYVDACAGYVATLIDLLEKGDVSYRFLEEDLMFSKLGVAFAKDSNSGVQEELVSVLRQMQEDGTTGQILESYGLDVEKALGGVNIE